MLSTDPQDKALLIRVRAMSSGSWCYFNIFWIYFIGRKSHNPSLATTMYLWLKRISILWTYGFAVSPMFFFNEKSPKARVIANEPPKRPIRILPPACLLQIKCTWLFAFNQDYRNDVKVLVFRQLYHQKDKQMNPPHDLHIVPSLPPRELGDRVYQWILIRICWQLVGYLRFRRILQKELFLSFCFWHMIHEKSRWKTKYLGHVFT